MLRSGIKTSEKLPYGKLNIQVFGKVKNNPIPEIIKGEKRKWETEQKYYW